jgi:hypothetical protein
MLLILTANSIVATAASRATWCAAWPSDGRCVDAARREGDVVNIVRVIGNVANQ